MENEPKLQFIDEKKLSDELNFIDSEINRLQNVVDNQEFVSLAQEIDKRLSSFKAEMFEHLQSFISDPITLNDPNLLSVFTILTDRSADLFTKLTSLAVERAKHHKKN